MELRSLLVGCLQLDEHGVDRRARNLGRLAQRDERVGQARRLQLGQAELLGHTAHAPQRLHDVARFGWALVAQLVDGITQFANLRNRNAVHIGQLGHAVARFFGQHVESHRHLGNRLGELGQVARCHAQLPPAGGNRRQPLRIDRDRARHAQQLVAQLHQPVGRIELHHLLHVGHGRFEVDGQLHRNRQRRRRRADPHGLALEVLTLLSQGVADLLVLAQCRLLGLELVKAAPQLERLCVGPGQLDRRARPHKVGPHRILAALERHHPSAQALDPGVH